MTQGMSAGKRRATPIVPAIPRKLERKTQPDIERTPLLKAEVKEPEQSAGGHTEHISIVANDSNRGPAHLDNGGEESWQPVTEDSVLEQQTGKGTALSPPQAPILHANQVLDQNERPTTHLQDFGIEKHGFQLPPPFYPSHPTPAFPPAAYSALAEPSGLQLASLDTNVGKEEDGRVEQEGVSHSSSSMPSKVSSVIPCSHPTPPEDVAPSPTESSYQGYGHAQFTPFYPQPTPPTEASISPAHSTYQGYGHAQPISFHPPPSSPFNDPSSPTESSYQGYTHGHPYNGPQAYYQHFDQSQRQPNTFVPLRNEYGSGLSHYNQAPVFSSLGSHPPLTPSATPLNSATTKSPEDLSSHQHSMNDSASTASTVPPNNESPHHPASESVPGFQDSLSFSSTSKPDSQIIAVEGLPTFEMWCNSKLESLQNVPLDALSGQPSLSDYLLRQFNTRDSYADCCLQITHQTNRFETTEFFVHRLLVAQSPKLRALIVDSEVGADGKTLVRLELQDSFSTPAAISFALRVCYGESTYTFTGSPLTTESSETAADVARSWMDNALAFAAAGQVLKLQSVVARGLQIATAILTWDNLERALSFTMDRGLDRTLATNTPLLPPFNFPRTGSTDNEGQHKTTDPSDDLLYFCLHFILANCPSSWNLDVSARPISDNDRLPTTTESRSPISKSRLSRIQFGDHPSELNAKLNDLNTILSSILLSVQFNILTYLLDHVEEPIKRRNGKNIILEREARRQKVLRSENVSSAQKQAAADLWAEAGWEEFVTEAEDSSLLFARRWVGF